MIPPFGLNRGLLQDEVIDNLIKESYDKKNWDGALEYIHQNVLFTHYGMKEILWLLLTIFVIIN